MNLLYTDTSSMDKHSSYRQTESLRDATDNQESSTKSQHDWMFAKYNELPQNNRDEKGISLEV